MIGAVILIFAIIILVQRTARPTNMLLNLGPTECTDAYRNQRITEFKDSIIMYGARQREGGADNELYSPEDALRQFKIYSACREDGIFPDAELEAYHEEIMTSARAIYIYLAEDVCAGWCRANAANAREERDEQGERHADLLDDYYETFGEERFAGPSDCSSSCGR